VAEYARTPAPGAVRPVELFCNSARFLYGEDQLASGAEATSWLRDHGLFAGDAGPLTEEELHRLVRFREVLRDHLGRVEPERTSALLTEFAAATLAAPRWDVDGSAQLSPVGATHVERLIGHLLATLFLGEVSGPAARLKPCRSADCRWLFYDRSPAGTGAWCSMEICGAREKMRAYRTRRSGR
jgi:predicted RNA-binding Zn ribbon-like protein